MWKHIRRIGKIVIFTGILFSLLLYLTDFQVHRTGAKYVLLSEDVPQVDAVIIPGAYVFPNGQVSAMLADRLDVGLELYKAGKAPRIVVSGDHGRNDYDEVNSMRKYLQSKGVPREDIFMDHAGFDTYDSMYRARDVFTIKKTVIVTQEFHLVRALYIARKLGMEAYGVTSDSYMYPNAAYYRMREVGARCKAFMQAGVFQPKPKFLGDVIPISGSGILTDDGK